MDPENPKLSRHEPGAPMRCPDPARDTVPVAGCDGAGALPDARRR